MSFRDKDKYKKESAKNGSQGEAGNGEGEAEDYFSEALLELFDSLR